MWFIPETVTRFLKTPNANKEFAAFVKTPHISCEIKTALKKTKHVLSSQNGFLPQKQYTQILPDVFSQTIYKHWCDKYKTVSSKVLMYVLVWWGHATYSNDFEHLYPKKIIKNRIIKKGPIWCICWANLLISPCIASTMRNPTQIPKDKKYMCITAIRV